MLDCTIMLHDIIILGIVSNKKEITIDIHNHIHKCRYLNKNDKLHINDYNSATAI